MEGETISFEGVFGVCIINQKTLSHKMTGNNGGGWVVMGVGWVEIGEI